MTEKKKFKLSITILIIIAIILIDQVSKILVINFVKQDVGIITLIKKSEEIKIADVIISILSDCVVFTVIIKFLKEQSKYMSTKVKYSLGGERGIRTPGALQHAGFQDRCIRPLYHLSLQRGSLCGLFASAKVETFVETTKCFRKKVGFFSIFLCFPCWNVVAME